MNPAVRVPDFKMAPDSGWLCQDRTRATLFYTLPARVGFAVRFAGAALCQGRTLATPMTGWGEMATEIGRDIHL